MTAHLPHHASLAERLEAHARDVPGERPYVDLDAHDAHTRAALSYAEIDREARGVAAEVQRHAKVGDRVVLCFDNGLDFVIAFWGCVYAGCVVATVDPPAAHNLGPSVALLSAIAKDAGAVLVLASPEAKALLDGAGAALPGLAGIACLAFSRGAFHDDALFRRPMLTPEHVAYLQYTSGSTGTPKGVIFTHANALGLQGPPPDRPQRTVLWTPLTHGSGLFAIVWITSVPGRTLGILKTSTVMEAPLRWLEAVQELARGGPVTSFGPDFIYALCTQSITPAERATLDLRGWKVAASLAERVRHETVEAFKQAFGVCGFDATLATAYGLTESGGHGTMGKASSVARLDPRGLARGEVVFAASSQDAAAYVTCGRAAPGLTVSIVNPGAKTVLGERAIGEVWLAGSVLPSGYWNRAQESADTFGGRLATGEGPFLRTGDLGFLSDGELFVVGRLKEIIIVRGAKHNPTDIETTLLQAFPWITAGACTVASGEIDGEERVIVAVEVDGAALAEARAKEIRAAVAAAHGLRVHAALFVKTGALQRTSMGKSRRKACFDAFQSGSLDLHAADVLGSTSAAGADATLATLREAIASRPLLSDPEKLPMITRHLRDLAAHLLRASRESVLTSAPLATLGFDSMLVQLLRHQIWRATGVEVTVSLLATGSLERVAATVLRSLATPEPPADDSANAVVGEAPMLPGQRSFFHSPHMDAGLFTVPPIVYEVAPDISPESIEDVLRLVFCQHDALRSRFVRDDDGTRRLVIDPFRAEDDFLTLLDASSVPLEQVPKAIPILLEQAAAELRVEEGALCRVALLEREPGSPRILTILSNHLIADHWSYLILTRDLLLACDALARREQPVLARKTTDIKAWGERLASLGASGAFHNEIDHWLEGTRGEAPTIADVASPSFHMAGTTLDERESKILRFDAPRRFDAPLPQLLRAAVALTLARETATSDVSFNWLSRGRDDLPDGIDLSRTIGMIYRDWPQTLRVPSGASIESVLDQIRTSDASIAHGGLGYEVLSWFDKDAALRAKLQTHPARHIRVNYVGDMALGALTDVASVRPLPPPRPTPRPPRSRLAFSIGIARERIQVSLTQHTEQAHVVRSLVERLAQTLREITRAVG